MSTRPLSIDMVQTVMKRYRPGMMSWHYEHGLVLLACLKAGAQYPGSELAQEIPAWVQSLYSPVIHDDGSIEGYSLGEHNLDQINPGRALFSLFDQTGDVRWLCAIDTLMRQIRTQPRCRNGVFWHKEIYPWQIWLDGLYMAQPFRAQWALRTGYLKEFDDILGQMTTVSETLKDNRTGLLYHAYDESRGQRWSDPNTGLSPHFWSRSIGWYAMALLEVLEMAKEIPAIASKPIYNEVLKAFQDICLAVRNHQSSSGMWFQATDLPEAEGNYLETSASSMLAYCFLKGSRLGMLSSDFIASGMKALGDIKARYLSADLHLGSICTVAGLGGNPYRDGSLKYYFKEPVAQDDFKGVGPFIMACLEAELIDQ